MHVPTNLDLHAFLATLALVLCTAAVTTVLFQRLRQPVILGYLLAGMLVGPHLTIMPAIANDEATHILAELGVILLLFGIGLEFSLRKLMRVGGSAAITGIIAISTIFWLGNGAARLMGWNPTEALFTGAAIAVSSTTIIAKAFDDRKIRGRLRDLVFGVLIIEDLVSILLLAALSTVAAGQAASAGSIAGTAFRLLSMLSVVLVIGLFTIPRVMRWVIGLGNNETTLVASVGLCFAGAYLADAAGYSVALGAFLAGSLIAESGKGRTVEHLVIPVRDIFAAIFFVSVGMLIDPALVREHWVAVVVLTALVVGGKIVAVSLGAFLSGAGNRVALQASMSMAQIGEFSFIIAAVGATSPLVRDFLYPVMVAVSAVTTLITPWLIGAAPAAAVYIDRKLPKPLQTFTAVYGTWLENLRAAPRERTMGQRVRRKVYWVLIDAGAIAAIIIGASLYGTRLGRMAVELVNMPLSAVRIGLIVVAALAVLPFVIGIIRMAAGLAALLAHAALPHGGRLDHAAAPRRVFVVMVEVILMFLVGLPLLAITQPFLPPFRGGIALFTALLVLGVTAWRTMTNLHGHVAAGSEVLLAALRDSLPPEQATREYGIPGAPEVDRLATATHLLPGMGTPQRFVVEASHFAAGKSLAELSVRGRTGSTVLAITRGDQGIPAPSKQERLEAGDQLVLVGSRAANAAAERLLMSGAWDDEPTDSPQGRA
jgi:CPA2 family monovalent cation:H+ antiporter-2